jgi:receptor protein-tyrosine kinase
VFAPTRPAPAQTGAPESVPELAAVGADARPAKQGGQGGQGGTAAAARPRIGSILVGAGLLQPPEVERVLAWAREEGVRFGGAAVAHRLVTADQLERALAQQYAFSILERGSSAVSPEVIAAFDPRNCAVSDLRRLRTTIRIAQRDAPASAPLRSVAVLSPGAAEGKSFVAANLAVTCAQTGLRTLLVDADLRRGRLRELFGLPDGPGLSTILVGRVLPGSIARVPGMPNLCVLPAGPFPPNPSELLSHDALAQLHQALVRTWDLVLFDTAGAADEPDAALVSHVAHAAIVVVRRDRSALHDMEALVASDAVRGVRVLATLYDEG